MGTPKRSKGYITRCNPFLVRPHVLPQDNSENVGLTTDFCLTCCMSIPILSVPTVHHHRQFLTHIVQPHALQVSLGHVGWLMPNIRCMNATIPSMRNAPCRYGAGRLIVIRGADGYASMPPLRAYLIIPSAHLKASAPTVPVGLQPPLWVKLPAPTTKRFSASQCCM